MSGCQPEVEGSTSLWKRMTDMNPKNPQSGTGEPKPKSRSLPAKIEVEFKDKDGKLMPNSEKDAYGKK
jgi:hypothetical protein